MIDTSSAQSAVALLRARPEADGGGKVLAEDVFESGHEPELARRVRDLGRLDDVDAVLVATGPGSFTGLRVGVSFGLGLALGRRLPLLGVSGLEIQSRRGSEPLTGLVEAGRGRVYWLAAGASRPQHGEPGELPPGPAAGWLRPRTEAAVRAAGVRLLAQSELDGFGVGALRSLPSARELAYGSVTLEYMHPPAVVGP